MSSEICKIRNISAIQCKLHEEETVKYFCRMHEAVCCGDCLVSRHNTCKTEFIKDLSDNFQQNEDYKTVTKNVEKLISNRKEFEKKIQEDEKDNKLMLEKALQDIKLFRLSINKYLDKLETDITCEIKNVMGENDTLLNMLENDCALLSTKLEEISNMLNSEMYKDNVLFIHTVECKRKVRESEMVISDMKSKSMKKYEFVCDQQLCRIVTSSQKLGTLVILNSAAFPLTSVCINEKGVRSLVAVGAKVKHNNPCWSYYYGSGTITDVHGDGKVKVKWGSGDSMRYIVGLDVSLICTLL